MARRSAAPVGGLSLRPKSRLRLSALLLVGAVSNSASPVPRIEINDNRVPAGLLRDGLLRIDLRIAEGEWHLDGDSRPGIVIRAFGETGRPLQLPGPLIRVPEGTVIQASIRNPLDTPLYFHGLGSDSTPLAPGSTRAVRVIGTKAGTYHYWASTRPGSFAERLPQDAGLSGAFIVDPPETTGPSRDRILVLGEWNRDGPRAGGVSLPGDLIRFSINGKSWPATERLTYQLGDTLRFRIINTTETPHPMHLHGFYFDVQSRGDGTRDTQYDPTQPPHLVVTERVAPGRTFTLAWVPDRAGYWLFHCHNNDHIVRNKPLDGSTLPPTQQMHAKNHAMEMMGGLVMGIEVRPNGTATAMEPATRRKLRLIARIDPTGDGTEAEPAYGYELEGGGRRAEAQGGLLPGPTILLKRGEPVSITVVNQLPEPTAVHWHGIELDSYMDGVGDFSGHPGRIAPVIAPRDSFEARFTPPRSGTFIYHPHADEIRQQEAGMSGALLVLDDPSAFDPSHDLVMLVSTPRRVADGNQVLLNGRLSPAPLELVVGERYRFRLINIHTYRPSLILRLQRDTTLLTWKAVAKDGMELPAARVTVGPSVQQMGNGETYDFEFTPSAPGPLRFVVTSGAGAVLVTLPIIVR